jgi:uncharacterized membrane protein YfcA
MDHLADGFALPAWLLAATVAVFVLAGLVKGVIGLGLPTISMALLALMMTPARAAALLVVPSLITNVWQIRPWSGLAPVLRRLAPMQVGVVVGTLAGALLFGAPSGHTASLLLGLALIVYAAWGLAGFRLVVPRSAERWLGPLIGAATGVVTAATGVFVIPAVPYLQALGLPRDDLIRAMGISFTVSTIALGFSLFAQSQYSGPLLTTSLLMLVPAIVGMQLGEWLRRRLSPELFRRIFLVSLVLLGAHMMIRELFAF